MLYVFSSFTFTLFCHLQFLCLYLPFVDLLLWICFYFTLYLLITLVRCSVLFVYLFLLHCHIPLCYPFHFVCCLFCYVIFFNMGQVSCSCTSFVFVCWAYLYVFVFFLHSKVVTVCVSTNSTSHCNNHDNEDDNWSKQASGTWLPLCKYYKALLGLCFDKRVDLSFLINCWYDVHIWNKPDCRILTEM